MAAEEQESNKDFGWCDFLFDLVKNDERRRRSRRITNDTKATNLVNETVALINNISELESIADLFSAYFREDHLYGDFDDLLCEFEAGDITSGQLKNELVNLIVQDEGDLVSWNFDSD